jgi:lipoprotein NlpD
VGQVLRVVPPTATRPVPPATVEVRPIDPRAASPAGAPAGTAQQGATAAGSSMATTQPVAPTAVAAAPAASPAVTPSATAPAPASAAASRDPDDDITWMWPADGTVAGTFNETRSKGLAILGRAGDPVVAAADGRVVYSGAGLRGYGNLVIVKHNNTYLSAYAHNQSLLVKEDQIVRRGQKIAEMGSSDAERVQLHFEIRRQGRPVDPAKLLPPR